MQQQLDRRPTESNSTTAQIPAALDSSRSKLVYLYLATAEAKTVEEVREALDIELISLYPVLNTLRSEGLVEKDGTRYVCPSA
ncbi:MULTISPECIES: helix-turn-helix domain-containing protein [Halorussus]|uniref:helix-turn-helix domain-containing protein n=1 Tax=Halorussus TaxID=1070314 RepID=UPI0020A0E047|nr:helix-turn-helix domain-containing protein [Halorussus vallis]USZ74260.1 TrmB family transcriptional regulator [Halorussus vallis]